MRRRITLADCYLSMFDLFGGFRPKTKAPEGFEADARALQSDLTVLRNDFLIAYNKFRAKNPSLELQNVRKFTRRDRKDAGEMVSLYN